MSEKYVAVKWTDFSMAKAFKEKAEEVGWIYNTSFTDFKDTGSKDNCLYFSLGFSAMPDQPAFAISYTSRRTFNLPQQWNEAIAAITSLYEEITGTAANNLQPSTVFTKLETASLMIGAGMCAEAQGAVDFIAQRSVEIAKAILYEANK
jgi:hypothetical protein